MFHRLTLCLIISALLLAACGSGPTEAPTAQPPTTEETAPPSDVEPEAPVVEKPAATLEPIQVLVETPTEMPEPTETAEPTATPEQLAAPAETTTPVPPTPEPTQRPAIVTLPTQPPAQIVSTSALVILDDETPAPPLTVIVSMNRELEGYHFRLSGLVRNDAGEPYAGLSMNATFFRDDGSRYGPVRVNVQCPILEPGASCPFLLEATDKGITKVMLHPDGHPTERQTVPVEVRGVGRYQDAIGYVHITGQVFNSSPVTIQDVTITGVLIDQLGQIVNAGVDLLVEPIDAGASAQFDVMIRYTAYTQYQLFVQALPR